MNAEAAPVAAKRKKRGLWVAIVSVVLLVLVVGAVAYLMLGRSGASTGSNLSTAQAARRTISVTVSGTGSAVAGNSVTVNPQISGTVKKLYVSVGDTVTAGDKLYTISSDTVENSYLQAKASLLQSQQSVTNAGAQVEQAENSLYSAKTAKIQAQQKLTLAEAEPTTVSTRAYDIKIATRELHSAAENVDNACTSVDAAELGHEAARASYKTAKNSYATAKKNTDQTAVTAPSDGVVTDLPLSKGSAVTAGTNSSSSGGASSSSGSSSGSSSSSSSSSNSGSSITITDMTSLQVELTVSEVDIPKVSVGQKATITFDAISGKTFTGSVKSILPNATTSSGVVNYTVYVRLDSLDSRMRTGMTASVDIQTQTARDVVAVPSAAVHTNNGTKYVIVVDKNTGATTVKTVTIGVTDDTYTQIVGGISAGDLVSTGSASSSSSSSSSSGASSSSSRGNSAGMLMGGGTGGPPSGGGGPGGN